MIKRQIRYNICTDTGEQILLRHRWTFAIINEQREISRIEERIITQLARCDDLFVNYQSPLPDSKGLYCRIFSISSEQGRIKNPEKIYNSKNFRKDRNLADKTEEKLEKYFQRLIS